MGDSIKDTILCRGKRAKFWSFFSDDTTSRNKKEQMVLGARYVDTLNNEYILREDPFRVIDALAEAESLRQSSSTPPPVNSERKLDGKTLGQLFLSEIRKSGLCNSIFPN